ncbi:MAG: hypothetical protein CMM49_00175 [Rhodospirillaceae bacterium]|nr:hypothetical protein [Rhodospirillaceae bacterium]|tara:strand:+ start:2794 stop:3900 length:1107 start_codon:yes stop_codon:yes gene_type:complete
METLQPYNHQNLYGHEKLEKNFVDLWLKNKIPHAIILSGQKGIGKSTLAYKISRFILDKSFKINEINHQVMFGEEDIYQNDLNIQKDSQIFKEVSMCINNNLYVIQEVFHDDEDNKKTEISIDDIRSLKSFFEKKSLNDSWRIAIIDSSDNLNKNASNALLKLLEEPPLNSLIILISHKPSTLLKTIKSRCVKYNLNSLKFENFIKVINKIKPSISKNEIDFLSILSSNSPGYCLEIIDQNGLEIYKKIINLFSKMPSLDLDEINKLNIIINNKKNNKTFYLFLNLVNEFIHRGVLNIYNIKNSNINYFKEEIELFNNIEINENNVIQIINCWTKLKDTIDKSQIFNLNNKSIIIEIFSEFSKCFNDY